MWVLFFGLNGNFNGKMTKINKMAKNHFFWGPKWFPKCLNGGFRGVFVLKSGLRILIRAPEVPFSVPPKEPKTPILGVLGGRKVIFGHFIYFGQFPIEIPIEAKKFYGQQKEGSYIKNKNCFENPRPNGTT